jgi:hypothetical protein
MRLFYLGLGEPMPGNAAVLAEHQMSAVRRVCERIDPLEVKMRPPVRLAIEPSLPWWRQD